MSEIIDPGGGRWAAEIDRLGGLHIMAVEPTNYFPMVVKPFGESGLQVTEWGLMTAIPANPSWASWDSGNPPREIIWQEF